ncbi:MAG: GNAT family N-acetyltransferase [Chloroflexota bacterium]
MTKIQLPPGFGLRPAASVDLDAIAVLIREVWQADGDPFMTETIDDLRNDWSRPGRNLTTDAWVVTAPNGQIVGFEEGLDRHGHAIILGGGYVHPEYLNLGIGTALVRRLEAWAGEHLAQAAPDLQVTIDFGGLGSYDQKSHALLESEGYKPVHYFWRMEVTLDCPPAAPMWPQGIDICPFDPEVQMRAIYAADEEVFEDHWGYFPTPFEKWKHRRTVERPFDPGLWHVAWDGDEIAGFSLTNYRNEIGWVSNLGVRLPRRKRGLGLALLLHSFHAFYERGTPTVGLGVDAENKTGATSLYEKAGMKTIQSYLTFEKVLRAGKEIGVQSLAE